MSPCLEKVVCSLRHHLVQGPESEIVCLLGPNPQQSDDLTTESRLLHDCFIRYWTLIQFNDIGNYTIWCSTHNDLKRMHSSVTWVSNILLAHLSRCGDLNVCTVHYCPARPRLIKDNGADTLFLPLEGIEVMRSVNWMDNMEQCGNNICNCGYTIAK